MIQGLTPGPELFTTNKDLVYTIMIGFIIINIILFFMAKLAIPWFSKITSVPSVILMPIVLVLCLVGSYAIDNSIESVGIAIVFGIIGYILPKYGFPVTPMLIAIVLGPIAENAMRQSLLLSDGSFLIFVQRPIALVFLILCILSIGLPILNKFKKNKTRN